MIIDKLAFTIHKTQILKVAENHKVYIFIVNVY